MATEPVVVVGASLAAVSFIDRLRAKGGDQPVVLVGAEPHLPYDRPPLSKRFLGEDSAAPQLLKPPEWYAENDVELRLGVAATGLDRDSLAVQVGAERLPASNVVIATGSRARSFPGVADHVVGLHQLRTLADASALSAVLGTPGDLVVLGAGFIGLEVAAAAARRGWKTVVLEREPSPLGRVLGAEVGRLCVRTLLREGVDIRCDSRVVALLGGDTVAGVQLDDGQSVAADAVMVGIGAVPNTEWLAESGVLTDNGVVCDGYGRSTVAGVWAVGDVARWPNGVTGRHDRVEQWQAARDHGTIVADALLGDTTAGGWASPPYFWSDLFESKIQFVGYCDPQARSHVVEREGKAVVVFGDDRLAGVLTLSATRALAHGRRLLLAGAGFDEACAWADAIL